jgi:hypothetical protein
MVSTLNAPPTLLKRAASAATLAPSVHNTQPWRFAIRGDSLEIRADRARQLPVLDPTGRQLHLSLGCAVFNARVSLADSGVGARVRMLPDPRRPDLVADLTIDPHTAVDERLAALEDAMRRRQTNRRKFTDSAVPDATVAEWVASAARESAVLRVVSGEQERLDVAQLSQRADTMQIADAAYRAELRAWTTVDPARMDGVRAMVVPHVDGTSGDEVPIRDFDTSGVGWLPAATRSTADQCLLLLGTAGDSAPQWLAAGQALERVWLELTAAGYTASLFTQPIEVPTIRGELRAALRLDMYPHLLMRVGHAGYTPSTHRRPVTEVLDS